MPPEPPILVYTLRTVTIGPAAPCMHRLECSGWVPELRTGHIEFTSQRAAAYFAQHHAAGRRATLRLYENGNNMGDRPIPAIEDIPVPAAHEDNGANFLSFFLKWPVMRQEKSAGSARPREAHATQQRSSKVHDHPAFFRSIPSDHPAEPRMRS